MNEHLTIVQRLCDNDYDTYIVGGAVRDLFSGIDPHDIDIVTQATPDQVQQLFEQDYNVQQVGKSFGVMLVDGYEVATFRQDRHNVLLDATKTVVSFAKTIHEDLGRRDLTVNALALCELTGVLVDNHNGREDLAKRIIRFVGDASERIQEDPDRIIRACRFLAKLEGEFAGGTLHSLQRNAHLVGSHVAVERIRLEVLKAMELERPSLFFAALHLIGALEYIFPAMTAAIGHEHGEHHVEDVWEHMMIAGDHASPKYPIVRLAAFLHDVGKPVSFTRSLESGKGNFHKHELESEELVVEMLEALRFSKDEVATVSGLARAHMWCGHKGISTKAVRKMLFRLNELSVTPQEWLRVRIADRAASIAKDNFTFADIRQRAEAIGLGAHAVQWETLPMSTHDLALSGGDIINLLGLKGAAISTLQKHLLNYVIENGEEFNEHYILLKEAAAHLARTVSTATVTNTQ